MEYLETLQHIPEGMRTERMIRLLEDVHPLYMLPGDPFVEEILIPGFRVADKVDCMVGFFSSHVLALLAPGLATYIAGSKNSFRLIISPLLSTQDKIAIEEGVSSVESVAERIMEDLIITEDLLQNHTLKCLSWLLRERKIEIKVALMKDALFHPKVWLFKSDNHVVAAHGSSNVTHAGIRRNLEQIAISRSWQDSGQSYTTEKLQNIFKNLWDDNHENCITIDIPDAIRQRLIHSYKSESPPTENELKKLYDRAIEISNESIPSHIRPDRSVQFTIPNWLDYKTGPFQHQGKAVTAWCDSGYQGILEMATGSGKTITSMIGAYHLYQKKRPLLIVIAVPYVPLIEQWCDEITTFGLNPVNLSKVGNPKKRGRELQRLRRQLRFDLSDIEVVVVSHDTLCTPNFLANLKEFDCNRLLIADEAHNLGRPSFINDPPDCFDYRLGLSATPVRQYDEAGTVALLRYFGPVVFHFTLEEAIGHCLVEYDYYVHPVYLSQSELEDWLYLTGKIKQNAWRHEDGNPDEYLSKLMWKRRALLETASGKVAMLVDLLNEEDKSNLRHTLIYTSDKGPDQLNNVNRLLSDNNILFHQLTAEETVNRKRTKQIIKSFQEGDIQVLTAKRVLDEGVNIPQICKAFILASTTVERQWVQRRGRLLRTCDAIGKTHSVIHDILALPPGLENGLDPDTRTLVRSELDRVQEFASLARNAGLPDGPHKVINQMVDAAFL
ncbi:MAG: DEAD/DEAH box helicase [Rhodothermaceae bacterium]|nr:DEAD/DEAH box helicase [Rhodothermaceae bacterium]MXZ57441.1 DEAD/DEAH box helicase [Rhodothermaceae bacterium]MYB90425.1 DEAD/DEAH box helicase [Rhodothermaceae bacterium]MYD68268.1 DEAD/DEAH box helicase [Rhodothermaceae bacterium]MYG44258.1 DEAD/DEAH box helicase [Rhodothermaceae bacterium]